MRTHAHACATLTAHERHLPLRNLRMRRACVAPKCRARTGASSRPHRPPHVTLPPVTPLDLGDNCIHQYRYTPGRITHEAHIPVAAGDGPRHFVFHPSLPVAYSGCELKSQVTVRGSGRPGCVWEGQQAGVGVC